MIDHFDQLRTKSLENYKSKSSPTIPILKKNCFKKILIVDDVLFNIRAIQIILEYEAKLDKSKICDTASNGEEALQRVKDDVESNNF